MIKYIFILSIFIGFGHISYSQDIDIFQKKKNDNFKFEDINTQMSFNEYQLLSRNLRMKEMMYAMVVPGYIHFYAKEKKTAYSILALRTAAYGELAYMLATESIDFSIIKTPNLTFKEDDLPKIDIYLTYGAIGIIIGTYLYDWIHGQYVLKRKQERIRYKYNMKMNLSFINSPNSIPVPGLSLNFQI